jgi:hypothetical protein
MKSIVHNQPNNSAIFTVFNESLFTEIWRETSTHIRQTLSDVLLRVLLVSIPIDIYDMVSPQVIYFAICLSFDDLCCGLFAWHLVMTSSQL